MIFVSVIAFGAWVYLLGFRGKFWRSSPVLEYTSEKPTARVAVVVPARNEAEHIAKSIRSLLEQDYAGSLSVILVDDNSTDNTRDIAVSLRSKDRLIIVSAPALPDGWTGKLWAVYQGLNQLNARVADYVLLTDADIEHAPGHISALVAKAEADRIDLVSELVHLHCRTAAERALIPAFVFFFQMLYPFAWVGDSNNPVAGAAGGTMLVRRRVLDQIGGVLPIRSNLIDDCALADQIKRNGGKIWLGHSEAAISLRAYASWREVWNMIARTAYVQLDRSPLKLVGCIGAMSVIYCAPPLLAMFGRGTARYLGAASWMSMALAFQPTLRRYGRSALWGLALPGIAVFYLCATIGSGVRHCRGTGGGWKSRNYSELPSH